MHCKPLVPERRRTQRAEGSRGQRFGHRRGSPKNRSADRRRSGPDTRAFRAFRRVRSSVGDGAARRIDRYGYLLLWPGEATYRIAEPGALRALLGELRLDVAPLSAAYVRSTGEGPRRLNAQTRRVEVSTRASRALLELATLHDLGDGGSLLCGFLLELMSAPASTPVCAPDELPVHAELRWTTRGALTFDVTSIARRIDIPALDLSAPPPSLDFVAAPPPAAAAEMLVSKAELAAFRTAPVDVPLPVRPDAQTPRSRPDAGLLLINASDELRVAWIDGVPVAWVAPGARALPHDVATGTIRAAMANVLGRQLGAGRRDCRAGDQ